MTPWGTSEACYYIFGMVFELKMVSIFLNGEKE